MNIFEFEAPHQSREIINILKESNTHRIERIVSNGTASPEGFWYDQSESEWVCVLEGYGVLEFENHKLTLTKGEYFYIPAHMKHRVAKTSSSPPCVWLCVFFKERD